MSNNAFAFDRNMTKEEVAILQGRTFVSDLVVGDKAYARIFFLCWGDSGLNIVADTTIEPLDEISWSDVGYTFLIERKAGGFFDLLTLEDRVKKPEPGSLAESLEALSSKKWASDIGGAIINRSDCADYLNRNPSAKFIPIGTINGFRDYKDWLLAIMRKDGEMKP